MLLLLYTEKPVPRSKELVVAHDDSSKKARLQKIQILDTETRVPASSTNYSTSERRLEKAGEGERER